MDKSNDMMINDKIVQQKTNNGWNIAWLIFFVLIAIIVLVIRGVNIPRS